MSHPLAAIGVTRPTSFDPRKQYARVIARGDEWFGDYDVNDLQEIFGHALAMLGRGLFHEGAILRETGGTIGQPSGVTIGADQLGSAGVYRGTETQLYTVKITAGGPAGTARYTFASTGTDGPAYAGEELVVQAIAPTLEAGLAALGTYGHDIGQQGVRVVFVNPNGFVTATNSWAVLATYGAQPPIVDGATITIADLLVYVEGMVSVVDGAALTYPAASSGFSVVYGEWTRRLVTRAEDADLSDPRSDRPQGCRWAWEITLRDHDTSLEPLGAGVAEKRVFPLYRWDRATDVVERVLPNPYRINIGLTEGALPAVRLLNIGENDVFRGILARRDAGAHGSYVIAPVGLIPRAALSTNPATPGKIRLALPPMRAHVEGIEVFRELASELEVDQAVETAVVTDEVLPAFVTGTNLYPLNKGAGDRPFPIQAITQLTAIVQIGAPGSGGYEPVTHGGSDDALAHPATSLVRISNTQGGPADYTQGAGAGNYNLVAGKVHWVSSPPANYFVVYRYNKTMVQGAGADYVLGGPGLNMVDFSPPGDNPVDGDTPQVDYAYFLPRTDVVILRPNGELEVVRGLPSETPEPPFIPLLTLPWVQVDAQPNSVTAVIRKFPNDRVTMEELNRMKAALEELTVNLALQDLENQARARTAGSFLDIWSDKFAATDRAALTYNAGAHVFDATVDTEAQELTLPFTQMIAALARVGAPVGQQDVRVGGQFFTLPYTPELAVDAMKWSEEHKVNPYADFRPEPPVMRLEPSQDVWLDTTTLDTTSTRIVQNGAHVDWSIVGVSTEVVTRVTEIPAAFMRQIPVRIAGFHFVPGERVRCRFAGKDVAFTALAPTVQGPDGFTVLAGADGAVLGQITVPPQVPSGVVGVELYGDRGLVGSIWPTNYLLRIRAPYTSNGRRRQVATETILTFVQNDPIAQSFVFPAARMIVQVDVPMAAKPASGTTPLIVELRATDRAGEASTPINEVLARQSRLPAGVNVGPSSSNLYTFDDPIFCVPNEFRSLVLRSASNDYKAFISKLQGADRVAGGTINTQQIDGGIFMDSSNNVDWTPHQDRDLRCKVWVAKMSALEARLYFGRVTAANTTAFFLNVDQVVPDGTSIEWQHSVDGLAIDNGAKVWTTFQPFSLVELAAVTGAVDLRAILRTTDPYVTPAVHRQNSSLLVQSNKLAGKYVGQRHLLTSAQTRVLGGIELRDTAAGASASSVLVSVDDGATWAAVTLTDAKPAPGGFTSYRWSKTGLGAGDYLRVRVDLATADRAKRPRVRNLYAFGEP